MKNGWKCLWEEFCMSNEEEVKPCKKRCHTPSVAANEVERGTVIEEKVVGPANSATRMRQAPTPFYDPFFIPQHSSGSKLDGGKIRVGLMLMDFPNALTEVALVTTYGANKYSDSGWRDVPNGVSRYTDALGRHLLGESVEGIYDMESGLMHAAQVAWNSLARLELMLKAMANVEEERNSPV